MKSVFLVLATATLAAAAAPTVPPLLIPNQGQATADTHFTLRTAHHHVAFQNSQLTWTGAGTNVTHTFPGSNPNITPQSGATTSGRVNLVIGPDPADWHTGIQPVSSLTYPDLYPGIDLLYKLDNKTLKREFLVSPGADPSVIQLAFEGAENLTLTRNGDLLIHTANTTLQEDAPVAWQTHPSGQRTPVTAAFHITSPTTASFTLGHYDPSLPLTIDPPVRLIATIGGSGDDTAFGLVSTSTHFYLAGISNSSDFPVTDGTTYAGDTDGTGDMVVTQLDLEGNIIWATYIGGTGTDFANGIAISNDHTSLTVSGWTTSGTTFPSLNPIPELTPGTKSDCAILQFDLDGTLTSASRFGGAEDDQLAAVATHSTTTPNAFLPGTLGFCGFTNSTDFPFPAENPNFGDKTKSSTNDLDALFITLNADLTPNVVSYHDLVTGSNAIALGIARCGFDEFAVTGWTDDPNFYHASTDIALGSREMFVTCFRHNGQRRFAKIRGGSGDDIGQGVTLGSSGALVVVGQTTSTDYPATGTTLPQAAHGGGTTDGFIQVFNRNSVNSAGVGTYFGGDAEDNLRAVSADPNGFIHFAGSTSSTDIRTTDAPQETFGGGDTDGLVGTLSVSVSSENITERFATYAGSGNTEGFTAVTPLAELPPESNSEPYLPVSAGGVRPPPPPSLAEPKKKGKHDKLLSIIPVFEDFLLYANGEKFVPEPPIDLAVAIFRTGPPVKTEYDNKTWDFDVRITNRSDFEAVGVYLYIELEGFGAKFYDPLTGPDIPDSVELSVFGDHTVTLSRFGARGDLRYDAIPANSSVRFRVRMDVHGQEEPPSFHAERLRSNSSDPFQFNNEARVRFVGNEAHISSESDPFALGDSIAANGIDTINIDTTLSPWINDPVSLSSGSQSFSLPLINLGGPLPLSATLHHSPDLGRSLSPFPGEDINLLPEHFWLEPFATLASHVELVPGRTFSTVQFGPGTFATFEQQPDGSWSLLQPLTVASRPIPAADHPVPYQLYETTERMWLVDPQRQLVYEFSLVLGSTNLLAIHDRNGNRLNYSYQTQASLPSSIDDGLGRSLALTYVPGALPGSQNLDSITDHTGRSWQFGYTGSTIDNYGAFTLRTLTDPENASTEFSYGAPDSPVHAVTAFELPEGNTPMISTYSTVTWAEETRDRVTSQTDATGNDHTFAYDPFVREITHTTPDTGTTTYALSGPNLPPTSITDAEDNTTTHTYNNANQRTSTTTPANDTTTLTYHPPTGNPATVTDALGQLTTYTYSAAAPKNFDAGFGGNNIAVTFHDLTRIDFPDGTNTRFEYDPNGNPLRTFDRLGNQTTNTFNTRGQLLTTLSPTGATATLTYNPDATLATSTTGETGTTTYTYDAQKRLVAVSPPVPAGDPADTASVTYDNLDRTTSATDPESRSTTATYDDNGNPATTTDGHTNSTATTYDDLDRQVTSTDRAGEATTTTYDNMSRPSTITTPAGVTTAYTYDLLGRPVSSTRGTSTWTASHDTVNRSSVISTPLAHSSTYTFDALDRLTSLTDPSGHTLSVSYDPANRPTTITDRLGRPKSFTYDNIDNLTGVTLHDALGNPLATANYDYDANSQMTAVTDLNGQTWPVSLTPENRLTSVADPLGNNTAYTHDHRGRTANINHADTRTTTFTYDRSDRITASTGSDGITINYTYDANRLLASAGAYTFVRDARDNITTSTFGTTAYAATYDADNRLATVSYHGGALTITYTYHPVTGLLASVSDSLTSTTVTFGYDADFRLTTITRPNGVDTTYTYDANGRTTRITDGTLTDIQLTYDADDRITSRSLSAPLDPAPILTESDISHTYDAASQIDTTGFAHDPVGRRTTSPDTTHTYDTRSRLTSDGSTTYSYDAFDRLTTIAGTTTTHFHHHPALPGIPLVAEFDTTTATPVRYYVYSHAGTLLYHIDLTGPSPEPRHHHFDLVGSTLVVTGGDGIPTDTYAYTAYGSLLASTGTSTQPFRYNGQLGVRAHRDLLLMGARWYDPTTSSFLSREPIWPQLGQPQRLNPYAYADRKPISLVDPDGLNPRTFNHSAFDYYTRRPGEPLGAGRIGLLVLFQRAMNFSAADEERRARNAAAFAIKYFVDPSAYFLNLIQMEGSAADQIDGAQPTTVVKPTNHPYSWLTKTPKHRNPPSDQRSVSTALAIEDTGSLVFIGGPSDSPGGDPHSALTIEDQGAISIGGLVSAAGGSSRDHSEPRGKLKTVPYQGLLDTVNITAPARVRLKLHLNPHPSFPPLRHDSDSILEFP